MPSALMLSWPFRVPAFQQAHAAYFAHHPAQYGALLVCSAYSAPLAFALLKAGDEFALQTAARQHVPLWIAFAQSLLGLGARAFAGVAAWTCPECTCMGTKQILACYKLFAVNGMRNRQNTSGALTDASGATCVLSGVHTCFAIRTLHQPHLGVLRPDFFAYLWKQADVQDVQSACR